MYPFTRRALALAAATALLLACGGDDTPPPAPETVPETAFTTISGEEWDTTAVRQVLHVFALGSHASDRQIQTWADQPPEEAIVEIITFDRFHRQLSPADRAGSEGDLDGMSGYWSAIGSHNIMPPDSVERFDVNSWDAPARVWFGSMTLTGANPVRNRIGLFETNYHLSVNQDAGVNNWQIIRFYDDIMDAHAEGRAYEDVLALAAQSAAVAVQYNHRHNRFIDARFEGNEDFAREFHQLFFGILGLDDHEYHELTTIRNTAKLLTDMEVERIEENSREDAHDSDEVTFGETYHYPGELEILHATIQSTTAEDGLQALADVAIQHEESMANLPLIIVGFLADDVIDDSEAATIQAAWASLPDRRLIDFLRAYAISETFHSPNRVKRWSSIERNVIISSRSTLREDEVTLGLFDPRGQIGDEGISVFRPLKNVFGGQTGLDAIATGNVFREAYNQSVDQYWRYGRTTQDQDGSRVWTRDWAAVMPDDGGTYPVRHVAEWLWERYIADGLDHFGPLERAHVYALLGSGEDFGYFINSDNSQEVYSLDDVTNDAHLRERISDMEVYRMALDSDDDDARREANERVGMAINFIIATPYAFIQEGR